MDRQTDFDIGGHVRMWRKEMGLIQKELAAKADMNATQLWGLENGRFSPSVRTVQRIANALGISLSELVSAPPERNPHAPDRIAAARKSRKYRAESRYLPIMKSSNSFQVADAATAERLAAEIANACEMESRFSILAPTGIPLFSNVSTSESGAEQLAYSLRAHLNVGSAVIHDTIPLLESHGVRVLETDMPEKPGAVSLYDPRNETLTVFISAKYRKKPWRRDFLLLSEIGRAFLFTRNGRMPYRETARSSRFVHHFAATFLQPESAVRNAVYSLNVKPGEWTFELLLRLKERFGVSAQFFNIRLKELALITRRLYVKFDAMIKKFYKDNGHGEPMARERRQGRLYDLSAMSQPSLT